MFHCGLLSIVYWLNTAVGHSFYSTGDWYTLPCIRERFATNVASYIIRVKKAKIVYIIEGDNCLTGDCFVNEFSLYQI